MDGGSHVRNGDRSRTVPRVLIPGVDVGVPGSPGGARASRPRRRWRGTGGPVRRRAGSAWGPVRGARVRSPELRRLRADGGDRSAGCGRGDARRDTPRLREPECPGGSAPAACQPGGAGVGRFPPGVAEVKPRVAGCGAPGGPSSSAWATNGAPGDGAGDRVEPRAPAWGRPAGVELWSFMPRYLGRSLR